MGFDLGDLAQADYWGSGCGWCWSYGLARVVSVLREAQEDAVARSQDGIRQVEVA